MTSTSSNDDQAAIRGETLTDRHLLGVAVNERITALAGAILLALIPVMLVTAEFLPQLLVVHIFVGVLLAGPVVVKMGSTGYRILRYYTNAPAYVRRGPPPSQLRILGALIYPATGLVMGTGMALFVAGPSRTRSLLVIHGISAVIWLAMIAIHVLSHGDRWSNLMAAEWRRRSTQRVPGRGYRLAMNVVALMVGAAVSAFLLIHLGSWENWTHAGAAGFLAR